MAEGEESNLPATIIGSLAGLPKALMPASLKALDRLFGATVDIPVAWLVQQKAKIDSQTKSFALVEQEIAKSASMLASSDTAIVERAVSALVRKAYTQQKNREAVAAAMLDELTEGQPTNSESAPETEALDIDEDWLNVFERHAENASTARMQKLWGRVIAGEVRHPGSYSMRTLRFLSEFSQSDALKFEEFCQNAFGDIAPSSIVKPDDIDLSKLLSLEAAGLIQGASGLGLSKTFTFNNNGVVFLREKDLCIGFRGEPGSSFNVKVIALSPLGEELIGLLPGRDARAVAAKIAPSLRTPVIQSAFLATVTNVGMLENLSLLWDNSAS
jgi:hypothetical protein